MLERLLSEMKANKKAGMVCPQLVYADGTLQISFKKIMTLKSKCFKWLALFSTIFKRLSQKEECYTTTNRALYPDYCISACWLVRKEVFKKVGNFDEKIFYAPEDADFCLRVWLGCFYVEYFPEASALHHTQRLSYRNRMIAISHLRGLLYFFGKYGLWWGRSAIYQKISTSIHIKYPLNH